MLLKYIVCLLIIASFYPVENFKIYYKHAND